MILPFAPESRTLRALAPIVVALLLGVAVTGSAPVRALAQEPLDTAAMRRIRAEGFSHSQVLETALGLSDLSPPRLAGSPGYLAAATWARDRLRSWHVPRAELEPWGRRTPSWLLEQFSVEMAAPWYMRLTAFPRAWSPSTRTPVTGPVTVIRLQADSDTVRLHGKLRGKVVLSGVYEGPEDRDSVALHRLSDRELDSLSRLTDPGEPRSMAADIDPWRESLARRRRLAAFLKAEGALALLEPSSSYLALRADGFQDYPDPPWVGVPSFVVSRPEWNRLYRLAGAGRAVRVRLSLRGRLVQEDTLGYDVVAEIPGSDPTLRDEVVMLGGHLDSWIAGSGATDNAAGCAVAMEVMRILQAQGFRPRRTIRLALWDAEETSEDYAGSMGYLRRHFGDPVTGASGPEHGRLSAYFNLDNGAGRIRGIYLQGDTAARGLFEALLAPFADLGAVTVSPARTGETDHIPFWGLGIPAFQFIQDPLDYETRTHHSNLDVGDYLIADDLRQASVVLASVVYHVAMRDAPVPQVRIGQ